MGMAWLGIPDPSTRLPVGGRSQRLTGRHSDCPVYEQVQWPLIPCAVKHLVLIAAAMVSIRGQVPGEQPWELFLGMMRWPAVRTEIIRRVCFCSPVGFPR